MTSTEKVHPYSAFVMQQNKWLPAVSAIQNFCPFRLKRVTLRQQNIFLQKNLQLTTKMTNFATSSGCLPRGYRRLHRRKRRLRNVCPDGHKLPNINPLSGRWQRSVGAQSWRYARKGAGILRCGSFSLYTTSTGVGRPSVVCPVTERQGKACDQRDRQAASSLRLYLFRQRKIWMNVDRQQQLI